MKGTPTVSHPIIDAIQNAIAAVAAEHALQEFEKTATKEAEGKTLEERLHRLEVEHLAVMDSVTNIAQAQTSMLDTIRKNAHNDMHFYTSFITALAGRVTGVKVEPHDVDEFMAVYLAKDHSDMGEEPSFILQGVDIANAFVDWLYERKGVRYPQS